MIRHSRSPFYVAMILTALAIPQFAQAGSTCTINGTTVANGGTITEYLQSSVPFGQSCSSEIRVCKGGKLSGSYTNASCTVQPPANCTFNGQTVLHNSGVLAWTQNSVPYSGPQYGVMCQNYQQYRMCYNGVLSGNAQYASCTIAAPRACTFDGNTYASSTTIMGYRESAPNYTTGATCQGEYMTCSDGTWNIGYDPVNGGFTPVSATCAPVVPVLATISPASMLKCAIRTTMGTQVFDGGFDLPPDTDIDCVNAANFAIVRASQTYGPRQAIWNYTSKIADYSYSYGYGAATIFNSKCAYTQDSNAPVFQDALIDMDSCRNYCMNASIASPASTVQCYFAHSATESFVNGVGNIGSSANWIPLPPWYYSGGG